MCEIGSVTVLLHVDVPSTNVNRSGKLRVVCTSPYVPRKINFVYAEFYEKC